MGVLGNAPKGPCAGSDLTVTETGSEDPTSVTTLVRSNSERDARSTRTASSGESGGAEVVTANAKANISMRAERSSRVPGHSDP